MKKAILLVAGFLLVCAGLALVINNWDVLVIIVQAVGGLMIALIGLVMMFAASLPGRQAGFKK
jgi:hypothetical protein